MWRGTPRTTYRFKTRLPCTLAPEVGTRYSPATRTELLQALCSGRTHNWPSCCPKNRTKGDKMHSLSNIHQKRRLGGSCKAAHKAVFKPGICFSTRKKSHLFHKADWTLIIFLTSEWTRKVLSLWKFHSWFRRKGTAKTFTDSQDQSDFVISPDSNLSMAADLSVWWKLKMGNTRTSQSKK